MLRLPPELATGIDRCYDSPIRHLNLAQSEPELIALAAPGDEPAAFPKAARKAWVREIPLPWARHSP